MNPALISHLCFCSFHFKGAAWRHEEDQPELSGFKWQDCPAAESGTHWILKHTQLNTLTLPEQLGGQNLNIFLICLHVTAGRSQRPPPGRVGHCCQAAEEPHRDGQVGEPAGELKPGAAGEEPCSRRREGPTGEGAPADTEYSGLREEELQPGLRGDQGAARWRWIPSIRLSTQIILIWTVISSLL